MSTADEIMPDPQGGSENTQESSETTYEAADDMHVTEGYAPNHQLGGASLMSEAPEAAQTSGEEGNREEAAKNDPENKNPSMP